MKIIELGAYTSTKDEVGTLYELELEVQIGNVEHKSNHYILILDGTRENKLLYLKNGKYVDNDCNIWSKK